MIFAFDDQVLRRADFGQVPVGMHIRIIVPENLLADGDGIVQQSGLAVFCGGGKEILDGLPCITRF